MYLHVVVQAWKEILLDFNLGEWLNLIVAKEGYGAFSNRSFVISDVSFHRSVSLGQTEKRSMRTEK